MINLQCSATNLSPIEIVHSQYGRSLILISYEGKPFGLPCHLVSDQIEIHNLPKLREDNGDISFIHIVVQSSYEYICTVVVLVPASSLSDPVLKLVEIKLLDVLDSVHPFLESHEFYNSLRKKS